MIRTAVLPGDKRVLPCKYLPPPETNCQVSLKNWESFDQLPLSSIKLIRADRAHSPCTHFHFGLEFNCPTQRYIIEFNSAYHPRCLLLLPGQASASASLLHQDLCCSSQLRRYKNCGSLDRTEITPQPPLLLPLQNYREFSHLLVLQLAKYCKGVLTQYSLGRKPWCSIKAASKTFIAFSQPKVKFEPSQIVNFSELTPSRIQYPHPTFIELIEWQEIFRLVGPGGERCGRR